MQASLDYLLIVEDDPDILKLLDATLTFKGYRVITARNGKEALDILLIKRPAIVIADIMMPRLDGFGLVHRIRLNPETRDIPVVFISATYVSEDDQDFALSIGATRFIQKPVDLDKFLVMIADLLEHGIPTGTKPLNEFDFYNEYRRRLEAKLKEKVKQIAREEHLLRTDPEQADAASLQASLRHAIGEQSELESLLQQVHDHMGKYASSEE